MKSCFYTTIAFSISNICSVQDGIALEMYHSRGTGYELCAIGMIPLKTLLRIGKPHGGTLQMKSIRDGALFATVEYDIDVNTEMIDALVSQKVHTYILGTNG